MKAKKASKWGFECPVCNEIVAPEKQLVAEDGWLVENVSEDSYTLDKPEAIKLYRYHDDCIGLDEPEEQEVWQCGECDTLYIDKEEAKTCCK